MNLFQDPRVLRESLAKSFLLPIIVLGTPTVFIPFLWHEHSIYTTQYIFMIMLAPAVLVRLVSLVIEHPKKALDWVLTVILLSIAIPVLLPVAIIDLVIMLSCRKYPKVIFFTAWVTAVFVVFLLGAWPRTRGFFPRNGTFVVAPNHSSAWIDYFLTVLFMGFKHPWTVVYGVNLHKYPVLGDFLKEYGIGVDRGNPISRANAANLMGEAVASGKRIIIFPEGTRRRTWHEEILQEFQEGAFKTAVDGQVPILPIVIHGAHEFSPPDKPFPFSPCKISVRILGLVSSQEVSRKVLKEKVFSVMKAELLKFEV